MIHYLVTAAHQYTLDAYLRQSWSAPVRDRIRVHCWEQLGALSELPRGAWIFSDVDRLDPERRRVIGLLAVTLGIALVWLARA